MRKNLLLLLLAAMSTMVSCDDNAQHKSKHEMAIDNLMTQCRNFDATTLSQELPGVWEIDTDVRYDDMWQKITDWYMVLGECNTDVGGWGGTKYEFSADGKCLYHVTTCGPSSDEYPKVFEWHYDVDKNLLVLSGDYTIQHKVSGFNGGYIVFESYDSTNEKNVRKIYKRIE